MTKETIIGIWNYVDDYEFVTLEELQRHVERDRCKWTLEQYLDRRVNTNLTRFNFDPYTGEAVDYKALRNRLFAATSTNK